MNISKHYAKKSALKKNELKCKCGSIRYDISIFEGDQEKGCFDEPWILVKCRACGAALFYNGA